MRQLPILALALTFAVTAEAAPTRYTIDWKAAESPGTTLGGVKITLTRLGGTWWYTDPVGPVLGNTGAADDARVDFDTKVTEFCVHVGGQNVGEIMTVTTSASTGNSYYAVDSGPYTTTVSGNQFSWSGTDSPYTKESQRVCVKNASGFDWVHYDHNGTGAGLVFNQGIYLDGAACTPTAWYRDADGDGYGDADVSTSACTAPTGYVADASDCNDAVAGIHPDATEGVGDEVDQNCDEAELCYVDADDDGYRTDGIVGSEDVDCADSGEGLAADPAGDCDDRVASIYPGAPEVAYDGVDQDCDGSDLCDVDGDGVLAGLGSCAGADCDDDDGDISPLAIEIWYDGVDQDCDGWSDFDADFDRFDDAEFGGDDCDDSDGDVNPDADETWYDGVDQDCDEADDFDRDGDGFLASGWGGDDCDDTDSAIYPGAAERDNGVDDDCNGLAETDDSDADGISDELELSLGLDPDSDDSDGDGLRDRDELGDPESPTDSDDDGIIDALDSDDDGDGIPTLIEAGDTGKLFDSDGDGTPDHLDLDSDDDGWPDELEGNVDTDQDGLADYVDSDSDQDGVADEDELDADTDDDGLADRVDPDDDGDGLPTAEEESWDDTDLDGDGKPAYLDDDSDGDGNLDADEGWADADCDDVPDVMDTDDLDGPCLNPAESSWQNGCSTSGAPIGLAGLLLALSLMGLRRRR